jgi:hypothetical protein
MARSPDWVETLNDLDRRRRHTWAMGGRERLAKYREAAAQPVTRTVILP